MNNLGYSEELFEQEQIIAAAAELRLHLRGLDLQTTSTVLGIAVGLSPKIELAHDNRITAEKEWDAKYDEAARRSLKRIEIGLPMSKEMVLNQARKVYVKRCTVNSGDIAWAIEQYLETKGYDWENLRPMWMISDELCKKSGMGYMLPSKINHSLIEKAVHDAREEYGDRMSVEDLREVAFMMIRLQNKMQDFAGTHISDPELVAYLLRGTFDWELASIQKRRAMQWDSKTMSPIYAKAGVIRWKM